MSSRMLAYRGKRNSTNGLPCRAGRWRMRTRRNPSPNTVSSRQPTARRGYTDGETGTAWRKSASATHMPTARQAAGRSKGACRKGDISGGGGLVCRSRSHLLQLADHGRRIGGAEDGGTSDKDIDTRSDERRGGGKGDASIDLDESLGARAADEVARLAHLVERVDDKGLPAKTRVDGHDEHHVDVTDDVGQLRHGCGGVEGNATTHTRLVYLVDGAVEVGAGFVVDGHHIGTQVGNLTDVAFGAFNHQVDVEGLAASTGHGLQNRESKGDVRHKGAVHHIEVEPVGTGGIDHLHLVGKVEEVSSQ